MWALMFLLPDLSIKKAIENEIIAIAPHNDPRVENIVEKDKIAKSLIDNFEDQFGRKKHPSCLITKELAPYRTHDLDALIGFRNICALSSIIKAHEYIAYRQFIAYPLYSDFFDVYPIFPSKDNDGFITRSPSIFGFDDDSQNFKGQTSPGLPSLGPFDLSSLGNVFDLMVKAWERRYIKTRKNEWVIRALFRSLEMAYQASSMPIKNYSTIYDYGASASLWVSAFEILSHPQNGSANLITVANLIGKYDWLNERLKRRYYTIKFRGKKMRVNLAQKLYNELYDTRNAFLHGNPVNENRLLPFGNKKARAITRYAPLLYHVAIVNYLTKNICLRKKTIWPKEYAQKYIFERNLGEALLTARIK